MDENCQIKFCCNIRNMDIFENVCRTCNIGRSKLLNIFEETLLNNISIQSMLEYCHLPVNINDGYPQEICYLCAKRLEITYNFLKQSKLAQLEFDKVIKYVEADTKEEVHAEGEVSPIVALEEVKIEETDLPSNEYNQFETNDKFEHYKAFDDVHYTDCKETSMTEDYSLMLQDTSTEIPPFNQEAPIAPDIGSNDTNTTGRHICSLCSKNFFTNNALTLHKKIVHRKSMRKE